MGEKRLSGKASHRCRITSEPSCKACVSDSKELTDDDHANLSTFHADVGGLAATTHNMEWQDLHCRFTTHIDQHKAQALAKTWSALLIELEKNPSQKEMLEKVQDALAERQVPFIGDLLQLAREAMTRIAANPFHNLIRFLVFS